MKWELVLILANMALGDCLLYENLLTETLAFCVWCERVFSVKFLFSLDFCLRSK